MARHPLVFRDFDRNWMVACSGSTVVALPAPYCFGMPMISDVKWSVCISMYNYSKYFFVVCSMFICKTVS